MSGVDFTDPRTSASATHAVDALQSIARREPDRHTLVTLGPLTNIAAAIMCDPLFLTRFNGVVAMGGAFDGIGNVHPVGEFNIWADPEAAKIVLDAAGVVTFVGWEISRTRAVITRAEQDSLRTLGPLGEFAVDINRCVDTYARDVSGLDGFDLPDPIAMAVAIDPSIATEISEVRIDIGTSPASRGGTFVDRSPSAVANARAVVDADELAFKTMLFDSCRESDDGAD